MGWVESRRWGKVVEADRIFGVCVWTVRVPVPAAGLIRCVCLRGSLLFEDYLEHKCGPQQTIITSPLAGLPCSM